MFSMLGFVTRVTVGIDVGMRLGVGIIVVGSSGARVYGVGATGEGSVDTLVGFAEQAPRKTIHMNKSSCTLIFMVLSEVKPKTESAAQRPALPAAGERQLAKRETAVAQDQLKKRAESQPSGAPRKSGAHFSRQKPSSRWGKYTPRRQIYKPYKAVEVCRRGIPEVHRGYRSH
jgi:hypothetical protein